MGLRSDGTFYVKEDRGGTRLGRFRPRYVVGLLSNNIGDREDITCKVDCRDDRMRAKG